MLLIVLAEVCVTLIYKVYLNLRLEKDSERNFKMLDVVALLKQLTFVMISRKRMHAIVILKPNVLMNSLYL